MAGTSAAATSRRNSARPRPPLAAAAAPPEREARRPLAAAGAPLEREARRPLAAAAAWLLTAAALALLLAAPAHAQSVEEVARALRSDPVYVAPGAELAGQVDAGALRDRIVATGAAPMFIAVLPENAMAGSPARTLLGIRRAVGRDGTYALAVGDEFRALSDYYEAARPGDAARRAHPDDLGAALGAFIDTTGEARADAGGGGGGALAALLAGIVLLGVLIVGSVTVVGRRRARAKDGRSTVGEVDVRDDFVRLGDGIRELEIDVTLGKAGRADYDRALAAYTRANDLQRKGDERGADRALDEGLAAIASARERVAGRKR